MKPTGLLTAILACSLLSGTAALAVPVVITYQNNAGQGFFDPTLGPARRACIEAAASNWANRLQGTVPIQVTATMVPLGGDASSAILGGASSRYTIWNFSQSVPQSVRYVISLANQIAGTDLVTPADVPAGQPSDDIFIQYNSDVDGPVVLSSASFYYGTDGRLTSSGGVYYDIDFYQTCFHELGHGLGFASGVNQDGSFGSGLPMIYDNFLATGPNANSPLFTSLTQAQRASALISNGLYWMGANGRAGAGNTNPRIYAPNPYQAGSTRSHLNESTYTGTLQHANMNELMTPYLGPGVMHYPGPITSGLFEDIGWNFLPYTMADATTALKDYAGLLPASEGDLVRNHRYGLSTYPGHLSMLDVVGVVRAAAGTETNPFVLGTP